MTKRAKLIERQFRAGTLPWPEMNVVRLLLAPPNNATFEEIANLQWEDIDMRVGGKLVLRSGGNDDD